MDFSPQYITQMNKVISKIMSSLASAEPQSQIILVWNLPSILIFGWVIATILLVLGFLEKEISLRKSKLTRWGVSIMGIMTLVTPFSWYVYWAVANGALLMTAGDVVILAFLSFIGGMILMFGIGTSRRE
jgi:small-conductance mechanosensitive channel